MRCRLGHSLTSLAGLVLTVALLASTPASAAAHARLTTSGPTNGAALDEMPARITLTFTEPVATGSARISVDTTLPGGGPVAGSIVVDGADIAADLVGASPELRTITVAWRVVSATDGHETTGLLIFSVGTGIPPRIDAAGSKQHPR